MRRITILLLSLSLLAGCAKKNDQTVTNEPVFKLESVATNLTSPVAITHANDGSNRQFVVEQPGRILILKDGKVSPNPFLDLTGIIIPLNNSYSEMGLLGLAFHPAYKQNGRFFVYYTAKEPGTQTPYKSVLAEYKTSAANSDQADTQGKILMEIDQPESNHNGGCLAFGPDGMLYIGLGDGGGAGDKHGTIGNGQNPEQLLGSILRLDVNQAGSGTPYGIPADNPFVDKPGRDEIYANGLRNPWRFSFDRITGKLFCGEVGQDKYEEIDIIEKGKNYGWRPMEGLHVFDQDLKNQLNGTYAPPISEYDHSLGKSVTGGYVYRGKEFPALIGKYIFADWTGRLFYLEPNGNDWVQKLGRVGDSDEGEVDLNINSFGEDESGEIYVVGQHQVGANSPSGAIFKLTLEK
ncbi:MAG: PQQ-dependent sugar dehydrogenase [Bacteroidota bacterium]